jgi:TetR/AcrR family transcriptional regulator
MTTNSGPARRPRDAESTRAALLRAATQVFADVGYAGARVDAIADRARVNKRMIYEYYGDKQELYREVLESRLAVPTFLSHEAGDPRAAMAEVVRWCFARFAEDPAFARLLAWALLARRSQRRHAALVSSAAPAITALSDVIQRGVEVGAFRADVDVEILRTTVIALCLGYFLQHDLLSASDSPMGSRRWTDDDFLEHGICRVLFDGITTGRVSP